MNLKYRPSTRIAGLLLLTVGTFILFHPSELLAAHQRVSFKTSDGGRIYGNLYGSGNHAVVLAHGAIFNKESWRSQAISMSAAGLSVLAIDFRGYGKSVSGTAGRALHLDVLAAMKYLKAQGKKRISLVGGSMGGSAVAKAVIAAKPGSVDRVILLAAGSVSEPVKLHGKVLFIATEGDWGSRMEAGYAAVTTSKKKVLLPGTAHAQHIFKTTQGPELLRQMIAWLTADGAAEE